MPASNDTIINLVNEIKQLQISHANETSRRLEKIEQYTFTGNGQPSLMTRMYSVEREMGEVKEKLSNIEEKIDILPAIATEISSIKTEKEYKHDHDVEKTGSKIQIVGGLFGVILGVVLGAIGQVLMVVFGYSGK